MLSRHPWVLIVLPCHREDGDKPHIVTSLGFMHFGRSQDREGEAGKAMACWGDQPHCSPGTSPVGFVIETPWWETFPTWAHQEGWSPISTFWVSLPSLGGSAGTLCTCLWDSRSPLPPTLASQKTYAEKWPG
jgi:hypothetical protein